MSAIMKGTIVGARWIAALTGLVLLLGGAAALAQENNDCYTDPTAEQCSETEVRDDVDVKVDSETQELDVEVLSDAQERDDEGALASTGLDGNLAVYAAGLLGFGALLLSIARRRDRGRSGVQG